jgi:membrane protease YdiL (CAAX protease family)
VSWSLIGIFYLSGGEWQTKGASIVAVAYMFIPMIVAFIVEKYSGNRQITKYLGISFRINKWFVVAWILMPVLAIATFGISLLFPDIHFSPDMSGFFERYSSKLTEEQIEQMRQSMDTLPVHPVWLSLVQGLIAGATVNAIAGFGEELGWRGFLVKEFRNFSFVKASLIIGLIWGIWHAPIILMGHNYPEHPVIGVLMMTVWCILLTPLFLYFRIKSRSVIQSAIMHGTLNATYGLSIMMVAGGNDLTTGMTGLPGFIVLVVVLFIIYAYDNRIAREQIMSGKMSQNH